MTADACVQVLATYASGYRTALTDDQYLAYAQFLQDAEVGDLRRAMDDLQQTGRAFFPTVPEIRAAMERTAPRLVYGATAPRTALPEPVRVALPSGQTVTLEDEQPYTCETCSDTGWHSYQCGEAARPRPWLKAQHCGRRETHAAHEWVRACHCREWNQDYQRKRAYQVQQAASRTARQERE